MKLARDLFFFAFALSPIARAGGLEPRDVPANASWVVHVDFESMARSEFLAALAEHGQDFARDFDLDRIEASFGIDPERELRGLTFFHCGGGRDDMTVVVRARPGVESAWKRIVAKSPPAPAIGARKVVSIGAGSGWSAACARESADERVYVFSSRATELAQALAVLDGGTADLSQAGASGIAARPSAGAIVFAAGATSSRGSSFMPRAIQLLDEFTDLESEECDALYAKVGALTFELGEERRDLVVRLELEVSAPDAAKASAQVLRDALARAQKRAAGTGAAAQVDRLAAALRIETTAARVSASYRYGATAFVADVLGAEKAMGVGKSH